MHCINSKQQNHATTSWAELLNYNKNRHSQDDLWSKIWLKQAGGAMTSAELFRPVNEGAFQDAKAILTVGGE